MRNYIKAGMCTALVSLMLFAAGCLPAGLSADAARRPQPTFNGNAWIAYWDFDRGLKEAVKIQSQLNSVMRQPLTETTKLYWWGLQKSSRPKSLPVIRQKLKSI